MTDEPTASFDPGMPPAILTRPPFAGFFYRLGVLITDIATLYLAGRILAPLLRTPLLDLNPVFPYLNLFLIYLYFLLGDGPLWAGRTAGRMFFRLHVVDATGQPLGWGAAARRALLKLLALLPILFAMRAFDVLYLSEVFPARSFLFAMFILRLITGIGIGLLLAMLLGLLLHPFRRGLHDQVADSYVTWRPTPASFHQVLNAELDQVSARRLRFVPRMALFFLLVVSVIMIMQNIRSLASAANRAEYQQFAAVREAYSLPGYDLIAINLPDPQVETRLIHDIQAERQRIRGSDKEVPTTETLRLSRVQLYGYDFKNLLPVYFRRHGAYHPQDWQQPATRQTLEGLRARVWADWLRRQASEPPEAAAVFANRQFSVQVVEPLQVLLYNDTRLRARVTGPADPAAGPLVFEEGRPTSATAPTAAAPATTATTPRETVRTDGSATTPTTSTR